MRILNWYYALRKNDFKIIVIDRVTAERRQQSTGESIVFAVRSRVFWEELYSV